MAEAARKTDDGGKHTGDPWSPSPHPITEGSPDVFINSKEAAREGDATTTHSKGSTTHNPSPQPPPKISGGSGTVFINSKAAARKGDSIDCGSKIDTGSSNVSIGD